jgi:hypothetical protein
MTRSRKLTPEQLWIARLFRAACADEALCTSLENPHESSGAAAWRRSSLSRSSESATRRVRKLLDSLEGEMKESRGLESSIHKG